MIRTQIQLSEQDYAALREAAHRAGRSMADCVREAVAQYLARATPGDKFLSHAGRFAPEPADDLKDHDAQWAEAIIEKRGL